MRRLTYLEGFRSTVRRYPDDVAVIAADGREVTYAELGERTDALAAALDARLGTGRCAGLAETRLAAVELMLASMKRGRACVQLPTRGAAGELVSMSGTAAARGLVFDEATVEKSAELADRQEFETLVGIGDAAAMIEDAERYDEVLAAANPSDVPEAPATEPPEYAVHFTSGTTGEPKAVLIDQTQAWLAASQAALEMSLTATDRALVCTPWYHGVTCFTWIFAHWLVGATLVLQRSFEPAAGLRLMETHETTGLLAVPTQLETLLRTQDDVGADLRALSYVRTGGSVVPDSLIREVGERFTEGVFNTYGQTEAVVNLSFAYPHEQDDHPGTIGQGTFYWELRVVETADPSEPPDPEAVVGAGETGEILARGPRMIDGYLGREAEGLFVEGSGEAGGRWLRTGDVARVDDDGYLVVIDRVDNMIISGGENVYPEAVQRALKDHPSVLDAGVVGLPDETWGEVVAAAVAVESDLSESDLDEHCTAHDTLANFKRPRRYVFVDEIPRTATGTLVRDEVVAMFDE
jgi:fatty-acyl-CoA synthase